MTSAENKREKDFVKFETNEELIDQKKSGISQLLLQLSAV